MFNIIFKQILKYKYYILFFLIFWIISGTFIYQNRYKFLSYIYHLTSSIPEPGKSNPNKAYNDFFKPAIKILQENQVDLLLMAKLCPKQIQTHILEDREYEWDFLKKYNFFYFDKNYIFNKSYIYWKEKQPYLLEVLTYLKEAIKYAYEIPANITEENKNILIPYILQQTYDALCFPDEAKIYWKNYIEYLEFYTYNQNIHNNLPYPKEWDLELLNHFIDDAKYHFAIFQFTGKTIPFQLIENCQNKSFFCTHLQEINDYWNKLIYTTSFPYTYHLFLNHARLYLIFFQKTQNQYYLYLALDRYKGAMDYSETQIDAFLEAAYVFLLLNQPENSLKILESFASIKPKRFLQESFYYEILYKTLTALKRYKEADCFKSKYLDTSECKYIRENF